jgi:hypothetical protein
MSGESAYTRDTWMYGKSAYTHSLHGRGESGVNPIMTIIRYMMHLSLDGNVHGLIHLIIMYFMQIQSVP